MKATRFVKMAASSSVLDGVFGINKPIGMSSAQVIRDCQHHFNPSTFFKPMIEQEKAIRAQESNSKRKRRGFGKNDLRVKMGHGGTLDPLATGVLILGVGKGTKSLQSFLDCTKVYETVVLFGASTDTYDRVGKILKKTSYDHITRPMVEEALDSFRGKYQQMPPLYSALKMEGKPLYEYAREGKPLPREIATREVEVSELELVEWYEPGEHPHRWPAEEATTFERNFAEQVWKLEKQQMTSKKLTPEEEEEETKALKEHENFKRKADESVDALVYDRVNNKRRKTSKRPSNPPLMSGALGSLPPAAPPKPGRGSNLIPTSLDPDAPPSWEDKGPPAAKIRMTVTSGFYVRSFCHDLGVKIGSAAMMAELCRSRQGEFVLGSSNCLEYSDLGKGESVWAPQVKDMLSQWNSKPRSAPTEAPIRAKQNPAATNEEKSAQSASPAKPKDSGNAEKSGDEDKPSSKAPALPTPKSSSPVQEAQPVEETVSKTEPANSDGPVTNGALPPTTTTLPKPQEVQEARGTQETQGTQGTQEIQEAQGDQEDKGVKETPKSDIKAKETDDESWNGFSDTPPAQKP
ncbi:trub family pseudouridylate synthase-containing protein [Hypomontagnella monticulosa]|nr:trub family pseudouridylate synthase-containing protein [Hypomontagnella monticulosa]